jgi:catechol 2,3-dioxygenase-like lactoylglutathione lyase family enzyme
MTVKAGYSTPMLHVADVARSLRFYERLGFELIDVEGDPASPGWARMHCEGGALMFLRAEAPFDPRAQAVLFYLYTPDLPALRAQLAAQGIEASGIGYPEYMPSGEVHLKDPDGYTILIGHWGKAEHEAWERELQRKQLRGGSSPRS